jgi:ABC-2 type transport system permease protein
MRVRREKVGPHGAARAVWWEAVRDNPVLTLALRRAMRRGSTFALEFLYVAALLALMAIVYLSVYASANWAGNVNERMGRMLFLWIGLVQTLFLSMSAGVLGAASIALEREQRTLEALRLTRLTPGAVLVGKYGSLLILHTLLIATSLPIASLSFLFGGVSPAELIRSALLAFLSMAAALAVGVACSAYCGRSAVAISLSVGITLGGLFGVPGLFAAYAGYTSPSGGALSTFLYVMVALNPLYAQTHLFLKAPGVPVQAADVTLLVLAAIGIIGWMLALMRLRSESRA